ncbi:MAG: hypothetical protein AAF004_09100 [Pseudomonadota bacterium]
MIRPLRQLHRLIWPALALGIGVALLGAVNLQQHLGHSHRHPPHVPAQTAQFVWQWHDATGEQQLRAVAATPLRASTGVADVYRMDGDKPVFVASLAAFRDGVTMRPSDTSVRLRVFDVVNNRWLGPAITVSER